MEKSVDRLWIVPSVSLLNLRPTEEKNAEYKSILRIFFVCDNSKIYQTTAVFIKYFEANW